MGKKKKTPSAADAPAEESPTPTDYAPAAEEAAAPSPEVAGEGSAVAQESTATVQEVGESGATTPPFGGEDGGEDDDSGAESLKRSLDALAAHVARVQVLVAEPSDVATGGPLADAEAGAF